MGISHPPEVRRFGVFEVDLHAAEVRKHGLRIKLQDQPLRILAILLEHPGELVTREELRKELWPEHTFVDFDRSLNKAMNKLRLALGDSAESPRFIETLPRHGYRFIAPIIGEVDHAVAAYSAVAKPETAPTSPPGEAVTQQAGLRTGLSREDLVSRFRLGRLHLIGLGAIVLICVVLYLGLVHRRSPTSIKPRRSVAVLGFRNLSGRSDQAWLSTALSDWISTELGAGEQLRMVPAENVARMKIELSLPDADSLGRDSLARIRKDLGTDLVVVGSYAALGEQSGGRIRLDLCLQDAENGETLKAISVTGTESDLFDLVSQAGAQLRSSLGVQAVTPEEAVTVGGALPSNPEAARLYSEGRAKLRVFDALAARERLQKAVAADPGFALSHSALATAWATLGYDENAKAEAQKAFELPSNLARAERLLVEGRYHEMSKDWEKAINIYRALFEFFPDSLDYGLALCNAQVSGGKGKDALATVEALRKLPPPLGDDPRIDLAESRAAESLGDFKRDLASAVQAAQKAQAAGASLLLARAQGEQSWAYQNLGRPDEAVAAANEAKQIFAAAGDRRGVARTTTDIGIALERQGDLAGAKRMYEESLAILRQIGSELGIANELDNLGDVLFALGDVSGARRKYEESLATDIEIGNQDGVALAKGALGSVLLALGDHSGAERICEESLELCRQIGDRSKAAIALACLGEAHRAEGNIEEARKEQTESLATFEEIGDKSSAAGVRLALIQLLIDQGNDMEAVATARRAAGESERGKAPRNESLANALLAQALLQQGKTGDAQRALERAAAILGKCHDRELELVVAVTAARVHAASGSRGDKAEAAKGLREVAKEATKMGFANYGLEARLALGECEMQAGNSTQGRADLLAVEKDAGNKGFALIARKAAVALRAGSAPAARPPTIPASR